MFSKRAKESAVSPIIGTILMVAITVIIASIIAAYVFGIAGRVESERTVAAAVTRMTNGNIVITYHGGPDADEVKELYVYMETEKKCLIEFSIPEAGQSCILTDSTPDIQKHIAVVSTFYDNSKQIILDVTI